MLVVHHLSGYSNKMRPKANRTKGYLRAERVLYKLSKTNTVLAFRAVSQN